MAVRTQPLSVLQKENAKIKTGKSTIPKSGELRAQQPDSSDRKALSTITNKLKPPKSDLSTSVYPNKAENNNKGGVCETFSCAKNGRARIVPRAVLGDITNGVVPRAALGDITNGVESFKGSDIAVKQKKAQGKNVKMGPNPRSQLTEEEKQKAYAWAREGIERVQFSGKDMEALNERIREEEVNRRVAQAISCRTEIPCFQPRAFQKDTPEITDVLKSVPLEDLCKKGNSPCDAMKLDDVDYDESFQECLEILQNASKNWPGTMEDCV